MTQVKVDRMCSVYVIPEDAPMSQQEIAKAFDTGKFEDKLKALKSLVIQIIHDESFPRMVMNVINSLVPLSDETHSLKKILLFYWEVIEKTHPNGSLKEEMILVCNSLRKDLLHPNEYIRGRTLKLLSRIQLRGILEPLQTAIVENVNHKHVYVRRNAIVCLYEIFLNFGDDLISDLDELMEKLLLNETDLSTKRNAFLLLFHANQQKALDYLSINYSDDSNQFGDILQLSILELFRKVCKKDPQQKPKLLKSIYQFSKSKSASVQYECANTLFAVSPSLASLKIAVQIYMSLINTQTDNNIKLVILDRLEAVNQLNPRVLEDRTQDLSQLLNQQSIDIRRKVLRLFQLKHENVVLLAQSLQKEFQKCQNLNDQSEYKVLMLQLINPMIHKFPQVHEVVAQTFIDSIICNNKMDDQCAQLAGQTLVKLVQLSDQPIQHKIVTALSNRFLDIHHMELYKATFTILGDYSVNPIRSFNQIKKAIGNLPLEHDKVVAKQEDENKQVVKTVILPDGTYGTQVIEKQDNEEHVSKLRELLMQNSFLASSLSRAFMKLLSKIQEFNKYSSQMLLIFCSLLRYYQKNTAKIDQDTLETITSSIRILTGKNPQDKLQEQYKKSDVVPELNIQFGSHQNYDKILKQPDDPIIIRQLKGISEFNEIDLADDETSIAIKQEENTYVSRLGHIVQLTGYCDPIYAEAFVNVHKYDIQFEVLMVNRWSKMVQNVQVEFRTQGESKVIEKAQGVILQPNQSARVRTTIKFSSQDIGVVYGAIHYENNAGIEQAYLVTKEINVDLIDFIIPATVQIEQFRKLWAKYEWENRIVINTNQNDPFKYVQFLEKQLKAKSIVENHPQGNIICVNMYAQTKFDDDFLVNVSAEVVNDKLQGFVRVRSKVKEIVVNLGDKIKVLQTKIE
ncbi:unnamed protein product [Paramecium primaurelia]|uniref:Coatomer subunit beta n=1 Tax=Paramecium primaurelia TaxID=5886 RepID=A0A8S1PJD0_PARPR|nr:unnamed protein product [Paramecium primaurelia]